MKEELHKAFGWLLLSNRPAHLFCVGVMALLLGWSAGIASIVALEYKDVQRGGWSCWDWRFGSSYKGLSTNNTNTNYTIIKNGTTNFNFTAGTFTKSTFTTPDTVVLGGYRAASGALAKNYQGRVYFFRINEDDTPIIDYYPCKRLSDGVEGFWDCVSQTFIEPM